MFYSMSTLSVVPCGLTACMYFLLLGEDGAQVVVEFS